MATSDQVGLNISRGSRDALHALAYRLTGEVGQRVTLDAALAAACAVATAKLPETVRALAQRTE